MTTPSNPSIQNTRSDHLIYLVDDDPLQVRLLAAQIGYFGYSVVEFTTIESLQEAIVRETPAVVLMDVIFPEGEIAGIDVIARLRSTIPVMPPVFFISGSHDFHARIEAVRAGGEAYFSKPVNIGAIIDALDRVVLGKNPEPYRVQIIDDSLIQAKTNALPLQRDGMQVSIITDPAVMLNTLEEFNPDIILLDMYLGDYTGLELAQVIRQMDAFLSVPIVFLSSETDREKQLEAVGLGGDDFLVKPIQAAHLISAVTSRIERYRPIRNLMYRDGLTNLLNHVSLKDRLEKEISRARRQKSEISFAMLDLDHFKAVNDQHGHAVGDRVLKSLSHLLVRRLRASDVIGRYGGEEFGVILPGAGPEQALQVLNEIRESFAKIRHQCGQTNFGATFSGGLTSQLSGSADETCLAADKALYKAKNAGRNQIKLAE